MSGGFLRTDEFERWAKQFDARLAKLDEVSQDVAVLKDRADRDDQQTRRISAIVAAAVSGAVSGIIAFFSRGSHA